MGEPQDTKNFIKTFNEIARHKHRYDVFRDFVTMSAISLHNAVAKSEKLEKEYMEIVSHYSKDEVNLISELFAQLILLLEPKPQDVLGSLYMQLELGNGKVGQFFTPPPIADFMASIVYGSDLDKLEKPFVTLSEPACGAGSMVLAFVNILIREGHNPMYKMWVQCIDIDRLAALMCYLQLSLWNVPAEVVVGNALTLETREVFYTPAHRLGFWESRLKVRQVENRVKKLVAENQYQKGDNSKPKSKTKAKPIFLEHSGKQKTVQIEFDF